MPFDATGPLLFPSGLRPKCDCKKNCVERFLCNPERASLFEMWMEQMNGRTLPEQNMYLFHLVRKVKAPCVVQLWDLPGSKQRSLHHFEMWHVAHGYCSAWQGRGSVENAKRTNWRMFDQPVCFRAWCSLHGVGNARMSRILQAVAEGKDQPYEDRRHTPTAKEKEQQNMCAKLDQRTMTEHKPFQHADM